MSDLSFKFCSLLLLFSKTNFTAIRLSLESDPLIQFETYFSITTPQESVTDYTTPSSSLPNTVATNNAKMEDTLVNNVSNQSEMWSLVRSMAVAVWYLNNSWVFLFFPWKPSHFHSRSRLTVLNLDFISTNPINLVLGENFCP